jgi:predicted 3-demethylubiquinone-9 3-methyltransferase (glyoxalase superfamily)
MSDSQIYTFIGFQDHAEEAINFYVSLFENSKINSLTKHPDSGRLLHATFTLNGHEYKAMDADENFNFSYGMSLFVECKDQEEVDHYWEKLTADGGAPGSCGWLKDKYGMSWQVVPRQLGEFMNSSDPNKVRHVFDAVENMHKIDIAALQAAYDQ